MATHALPVLYTLFLWWFSTGLILYLNGLPRHTHKWTMLGATLLLIVGLAGLAATRADDGIAAAYVAFTCSLLVWAWQEVAFLLGYVTGPRRSPCPVGAAGWARARYAVQAVLHHELALIVLGAAVLLVTSGGVNQVGPNVYLILWIMRQSAKLNVYFGVRNLNENFLPRHLAYLQSYFRRRPMNALFPVSVATSTWVAVLVWQSAAETGLGPSEVTALTFSATLLSLAILEHWFMVLPLPSEALWHWALRRRDPVRHDPAQPGPHPGTSASAAPRV
jgi:putative photosynthetic complex assembly protein 2